MPLYEYVCDAGHGFERIVPLATFNKPQTCDCGASSAKRLAMPRVISDCIEARYGSDGKMHDSKQSWQASLKAAGHVQLAPGEEIKPIVKDAKAERRVLRDNIKEAIQDVKYGRVPPPSPPVAGTNHV